VPVYTFYGFELFFCLLFGYIFLNMIETSPDLAVDAAGDVVERAPASAAEVAGKMAPELVLLSDKHHCKLYKELCDMEMPFVDNGNMKQFHKEFLNYFLSLLLFKEKHGHL